MTQKTKKNIWGTIYNQLSSIKMAIILLIILGLFSIIAILLGEFFPGNFMNWENNYIQKMGVFKFEMFRFLGVFDPYHSLWFQIPLVLLVINIIVCTSERSKGNLKMAFKTSFRDSEQEIKLLKNNATVNVDSPRAEVLSKAKEFLSGKGFRVEQKESLLFGTKGGFSRLGPILFHLGLVLTLLGGLLIGMFGHSEYLWGTKGSILQPKNADFSVRVDDFQILTNEKSGQVKDYLATLTVLDDSQEVKQKVVEVNFPLRYKGFTFYQSSYRAMPNEIKSVKIKIFQEVPALKDTVVEVPFQEDLDLPSWKMRLHALTFIPDFRISGDSIYTASMEARNPALQVMVHPAEGQPYSQWLFAKFPQFHKTQPGTVKLQFIDFDQALFTGLQVSRKPGGSFVWIGIVFMTIGLILSFYIYHKRLWLLVDSDSAAKSKVVIGGNINKNQESFNLEFKQLIEQLKKPLKA